MSKLEISHEKGDMLGLFLHKVLLTDGDRAGFQFFMCVTLDLNSAAVVLEEAWSDFAPG
jgi:hypothetical protein